MKEEYIVKLDPEDEYTHTPDESSNYNESMYFNVFDHKKKIGGWFRLGNRPNEGYSEMSCCLYLPDGKVGFMFGKPSISDNNSFIALDSANASDINLLNSFSSFIANAASALIVAGFSISQVLS